MNTCAISMHKIRAVLGAKRMILRRILAEMRTSDKVLLVLVALALLGTLCGSFLRLLADERRGPDLTIMLTVAILAAGMFGNLGFVARRFFKAKENRLLILLPLTASEFFWIKTIESVFWNLLTLFPIGCSLLIAFAIVLPGMRRWAILLVPAWLILTIGIALLQSLLVELSRPLTERLAFKRRRKRKKHGLWIALQTTFPFLQNRPASLILKNLCIPFRRSRVSQTVLPIYLFLIVLLLSAFLTLGVRNLAKAGDWNAARNLQMFFGGLVVIALPLKAFEFSKEEMTWLLRTMPLSGRRFYGAEYLGLCGLSLFAVLSILLPSLIAVLFLGGQVLTVLCFVLLGSAFFPLWAMSIKGFVFPRGQLGLSIYMYSVIVGSVSILVFPPTVLIMLFLAWRFTRIGIVRLGHYAEGIA